MSGRRPLIMMLSANPLPLSMLSLPNDGRYLARELAPQQSRQKTLEALIGRIEALAHQTPILMIFEDAHWADPSSLELLGRLVDRIDSFRVLLLVVFRPEFAAPWIGRPHVTASSPAITCATSGSKDYVGALDCADKATGFRINPLSCALPPGHPRLLPFGAPWTANLVDASRRMTATLSACQFFYECKIAERAKSGMQQR